MSDTAFSESMAFWGNLVVTKIEAVFFCLDYQWRFTYLNDYAAVMLGRSIKELVGKFMWQEFPTLIGTPLEGFYRRTMESDTPDWLEYFSNTRQKWYEVRAYPVEDGLIVFFQDITERKILEKNLQESESRFRTLNEAALEGLIIFQDGLIVEANGVALNMFGYDSVAELIGQPINNLFSPESLPEIHRRMRQKATVSYEVIGVKKDGTTFPAQRQGKSVEYQGRPARVVALWDLTPQKQMEQDLRENEERYRVLSESAYEGLVLHKDGRILVANEAMSRLSGYRVAELTEMSLFDLLSPADQEALRKRLVTDAEAAITSAECVRKDGSSYFIEVRSKMVTYKGQQVRLAAVRDVTDIKRAEEVIKKTQAQLLHSQKMESIGRLAGGVAHDFNNLLTAISGYSEMALIKLSENDPLVSDLEEIVLATERAAALTRQLLIFSRQQVVQFKPTNLNKVVDGVEKLLRRLLGEDIELFKLPGNNLGEVMADPNQLEQIIMNLAINARDAMPDGGKLIIETSNIEIDEAYAGVTPSNIAPGFYVMLVVSDTGIGMDQATKERIFEPFFTTKPVGKGSGLGLATVYGIVEQAGGFIWVYSELGRGTSFKIYLPRIKDQSVLPPLPTLVASPNQQIALKNRTEKGYTILVVEDDTILRELLKRVLQEAGHSVILAQNGLEAIEALEYYSARIEAGIQKDLQLELVISDMIMPKMGGKELISTLRQKWPSLKLLCMSGYTEQVVGRQDFLMQCDFFLQKPFSPRLLLEKIEETMS